MNKIYVGNLSFSVTEDELENRFAEFGQIESINIIRDRATGNSKGFGFIEFKTSDSANSACSIDQQEFMGRKLRVNIARERTEGGGGGQKRRPQRQQRERHYDD